MSEQIEAPPGVFTGADGLEVRRLPILSDNYAWWLRCPHSGQTAVVDPADADAITRAIDGLGGRLDTILITHHHDDHIAGVDAVRARFGARVIGNAADAHRLPKLDEAVRPGDTIHIGDHAARIIDTPGHTRGHIVYAFESAKVLFSADTLFSLGCGRLFEGSPEEMFASMRALDGLDDDTWVCCGHEYTASNAKFALHEDPDNPALKAWAGEVARLRAAGLPTVPTRLGLERAANPFLRAPDAVEFGRLRRGKDSF